MKLKPTRRKQREANLISMINIIFLMLVFFLVSATIIPFSLHGLALPETPDKRAQTPATKPQNYLLMKQNGELVWKDKTWNLRELETQPGLVATIKRQEKFYVVADARMEAVQLLPVLNMLQQHGHENIYLLTRKKTQ